MSAAISGAFLCIRPGYRCAHPGYKISLPPRSAKIFSAARRCGLSIILPSILTTPEVGLSLKALTTFSDQAISSSVGMKAALTTSTCLGWITALARKPSRRAAIDSSLSASRSLISVAMVSMATTPAAAALIRQRSRASRNGPWKRPPVRFRDAPSDAAKSSAPHIMPHNRGLMFSKSSSLRTALAVSVATVTILVEPCSIPAAASKASRYSESRLTSVAPAHFGSTMPSGRPGMTAARSPSVMSVSSALTRTYILWLGFRVSSISRTVRRAPTFSSGAIESSRSRISASAAVFLAFSNLRRLSPGTNRNDRIDLRFRFAVHQPGATTACHHLAALIGHGVLEFDDALVRPRLALAFGDDLGMRLERIAVNHRLWKFNVGHAEVADRGAQRRIVDAH